jgi:hypothetical protein
MLKSSRRKDRTYYRTKIKNNLFSKTNKDRLLSEVIEVQSP